MVSLEQALSSDAILDDVRALAVHFPSLTGLATYRGIVRCSCGRPVLLHMETVWRNQEPTVLRAAISGENCPDCGRALSPSVVTYAGIYSAGWPLIPTTTVNSADLHHAVALLELEKK
jgi:hypothetical protein